MPLTKTEIAYIAGIFDGEGSVSLVKSHAARTRGRYIYPLVRIANTDEALINWLEKKIPFGHRLYTSYRNGSYKKVHHFGCACGEAIEFLRLILPYLIIKHKRAKLLLNYWAENEKARLDAGGYFGNHHPIPDWLMERRNAVAKELARLNQKGRVSISH